MPIMYRIEVPDDPEKAIQGYADLLVKGGNYLLLLGGTMRKILTPEQIAEAERRAAARGWFRPEAP